jgi:2-dehydropantoate 2-reductase
MKICIYGAGAIGGYLGVRLARAGVLALVALVAQRANIAGLHGEGRPIEAKSLILA